MDGFSGYNQIHIKNEDQHKTTFIFPWGTFRYQKMPFSLKNIGAAFQRAMPYAFHDINKIVKIYLDDLKTKYSRRVEHCAHLRVIFIRCHQYNIRLNPHKCIFCVDFGRLLGFIVSKDGIWVDPLKVEEILQFLYPKTIRQLEILQGKEKFLRRFITGYAEISKGSMYLLKHDTPFIWDEQAPLF